VLAVFWFAFWSALLLAEAEFWSEVDEVEGVAAVAAALWSVLVVLLGMVLLAVEVF
jgi:hypothetical protein